MPDSESAHNKKHEHIEILLNYQFVQFNVKINIQMWITLYKV